MSAPPADEFEMLQRLRATPELFQALGEDRGSEFQLQQQLRAAFPDELVRAALTLVDLRRKAHAKFTRAEQMWFDRTGLEQATAEAVAAHKARRFEGRVWDYCCGIGADATALAAHGDVLAVDKRPAACLMARWNAEVYGVASRVTPICADVTTLGDRSGWLHVDPDRRAGGRGRSLRVEDFVPDLDWLRQAMGEFAGGAVKVSPASNFLGKFPGTEIELVSLDGECKEATIWFGGLAGECPFRATVLPAGATLSGDPLQDRADVSPPAAYIYDPDPSIVRAGLVDRLAVELGLDRLDESEEYLTSSTLVETPFAQAFELDAELPNNDRAIRAHFRGADVGQLEIKCRHIPVQAEVVRKKLALSGGKPGVLIFARTAGRARALVCRRVGGN